MASGFFAVFDDIAVLMDDVATMSKVATRKTAGILADDLAVNAEKASGFVSKRELPILWKITKGSLLNKLIILPVAFLLSAFFPPAIIAILLFGGAYLAYEGAHKIYDYFFHKKKKHIPSAPKTGDINISEYEKQKIKSAILVDFILSVEIIIIALSTVTEEALSVQIISVTIVAVLATVGVYGLVALLVRMDDFGYKLIALNEEDSSFSDTVGKALVNSLPFIIRALSVIGTLAMILVGGGIFVHNIEYVHHLVHALPALLGEFLVGLAVGFVVLLILKGVKALFGKNHK